MAVKGVLIEYDFAAMDGAELLYRTAKRFLKDLDGIPFDGKSEIKYLSGRNLQEGLSEYFGVVKTKKTAVKAARDLTAAFGAALDAAVLKSVMPSFRNFVKALSDRGVRVVISTRADVGVVAPAFEAMLSPAVSLFHETATTYGFLKCESWRRACAASGLRPSTTVAVAGSGLSVKSAMIAGLPAVAVLNEHVAYQDCSGADVVVSELSGTTAKKLLGALRID